MARFHRFLNLDLSHHLVAPLKNSGDVLTELGKKFHAPSRDKSLYESLKSEGSVEERGDPLRRRVFPVGCDLTVNEIFLKEFYSAYSPNQTLEKV